jgi:signal transduction histidine kinase
MRLQSLEVSSDYWHEFLLDRNVRGLRLGALFALFLYPGFGLLDAVTVPQHLLTKFFAIRSFVALNALAILLSLKTKFLGQHVIAISAYFSMLCSYGIIAMTSLLGGFSSEYYSGINLVLVASGFVCMWPPRVAAFVPFAVLLGYVLLNIRNISGIDDVQTYAGSLFFVGATGIIVAVAQSSSYRLQRNEVIARHNLEVAKKELEKAHEQLKELDRFKSQVFANITHELKTPLTMILSVAELLSKGEHGEISETAKTAVQTILKHALKLLSLIDDILDLSKLQESRLRLRVQEHDLVAYLKGLVAQVAPLTRRKEIEVSFCAYCPEALVYCDIEQIDRVFLNLLSNAAKFTPEGGNIWVELKETQDAYIVSVKDNGQGFPKELCSKVFERFFQVDMGATRRHGGTGIGLALAKELVELHGGEIWAESDEGQGATFFVKLFKGKGHIREEVIDRRSEERDMPFGRRAEDRGLMQWAQRLAPKENIRLIGIETATERRVVERDQDQDKKRWTCLVVEDMPDVTRVISMALRPLFKLMAADNGIKALELIKKEVPDIVITDLMMPEMDGIELTRRLRLDPKTKHIPIIMLTARGDQADKLLGLEAGVNDYITKPFSPTELLAKVKSILNIEETHAEMLLSKQIDSLKVMAGGIAHEINNPLNYIKNALFVAKKDMDSIVAIALSNRQDDESAKQINILAERVKKMFETAEGGTKRIAKAVETLIGYSREGFTMLERPYDIFKACEEIVPVLLTATGRDVKVTIECEGDGTVMCVPEEMNQVLTNLIQNAIEAVPNDGTGRVWVQGKNVEEKVVLSVKDNGVGIPKEIKERIFSPFFTTKRERQGMGLGLSIVWQIVHKCGGTITVESEPSQGALFTVTLPRAHQAQKTMKAKVAQIS